MTLTTKPLRMPLALDADDALLARVREILDWLWRDMSSTYRRLFAPGQRRLPIPAPPPFLCTPLVACGLIAEVTGDDGEPAVVGLRRIRAFTGGATSTAVRHTVLELGLGHNFEYHQDVWPETDALVAAVAALDGRGRRVLDLGTGSGVVAIEAAVRGHAVLATDLFETALALARWNARLNGVADRIAFAEGHLWAAVPRSERFDLVVTNPHYGWASDQLRVEALRGAVGRLHEGGRLVLATQLEWEGGRRAPRLGIAPVLERVAADGLDVTVAPLLLDEDDKKRTWFALVEGPAALGPVISRARFTVEARAASGAGAVRVAWPSRWETLGPIRDLVPLGRLKRSGVHAALGDGDDVAALEALLISLDGNSPRPAQVPATLLDVCRFGGRLCAERGGAARGVLDRAGGIRPCTRGERIGDAVEDTESTLVVRLAALAIEREVARGCPSCAARAECSRCLFPAVLSDAAYCAFVRTHAARLPRLRRLLDLVEDLDDRGVPAGRLAIEVWPARDEDERAGVEPIWTIERGGRVFVQRGPSRQIPAQLMLPRATEVPPVGAAAALALARGITSPAAIAERGWATHPPATVRVALAEVEAAIGD